MIFIGLGLRDLGLLMSSFSQLPWNGPSVQLVFFPIVGVELISSLKPPILHVVDSPCFIG